MKTSKSRSTLLLPLIIGYGIIVVILLSIWLTHQRQLNHLHQTIQTGLVAVEKMELIASLIEIARARTRLTNKMLHTEDIFERDEINLELDVLASQFSKKRVSLIDLGLSQAEQSILDHQMGSIKPTLALQREAAEMALSDDPEILAQARNILINQVYPGQGIIIDHFMQLLNVQKVAIDDASATALKRYNSAQHYESSLTSSIIILVIIIAFITIRRTLNTERDLYLEKEKAQITFRSIGDAILTTDKNGNIEYINSTAESIIGILTEQAIGKPITEIFRAYDEANDRWLADCIIRQLNSKEYTLPSNDVVLIGGDNIKRDIALTFAPILDVNNVIIGSVTTFHDVTETKSLAKHIEHQAQHDALTGLLNRNEFENKVNHALKLYSEDTSHALCMMDLDRFKIVNDTVGHAAGDELLRQLSRRLKDQLRKSDLVARIGGDEFAIFLSNVTQQQATHLMEEVLNMVREFTFFWNGKNFRVGASIGLVDVPPEASDYEYLYHAADTACYMAKHEGRDRLHIVNIDDEWLKNERLDTQWINRINEALEQDEFVLFEQDIAPIGHHQDARRHVEILIRLKDEYGELIPPMAFIPAAERYNQMKQIDHWVLQHVVEHARNDNSDTIYGINLSGQSMGDGRFTQSVIDLLKTSGIKPSKLCFEITETAAIANLENAREFLNGLQSLGCLTALDDFGSGLSSFAYLRNLPIDYLKIDGMFIKNIAEDSTNRVMVEAIKAIGSTMQIEIIAEYVENEAILNTLEGIGIHYGQGFHIGKPKPLA